jgi:hypothetical protein
MSYRLEIGLALLFLAALAFVAWAGSRHSRTGELDFRPSTFLTGPRGSKALYDVLTALGQQTERRRTSLKNLTTLRSRRPAVLVVLNPVLPMADDELEQVVRYLRGGGAVVASGEGAGITSCLGWRIQPEFGEADSVTVQSPPGTRLPRAGHVLAVAEPVPASAVDSVSLRSLKKADEADDSRPSICNTLQPFATDTIVVALNHRPVLLRLDYRGGGTATLAADPAWFTNRFWRDTDVPVVAVPLLTPTHAGGKIVWDEYHQGFGEEQSGPSLSLQTLDWLRRSPAGWAILQLIAVALVWLATTAVRSGPARATIERRRRSPLEHLEALGAGLESAEDVNTAVQRLAIGLRRRLSRAGHTSGGEVLPWIDGLELAMRRPKGRHAVRRLHSLLTARDQDPQRVLDTAQAVEDVWEELRPPKTRNGS